jgi:hypothetical protein
MTPVPANQIDANPVGYVAARDGTMPSHNLWLFTVRRNSLSGVPIFDPAKALATPDYSLPPNVQQPGPPGAFPLDASDARLTQAVQAEDPWFHTFSFWTQHTIGHLQTASGKWIAVVRWYEIDPVPATPTIKNWGELLKITDDDYFNAAISPDRTAKGRFGNSFVVEFNHVSLQSNIYPDIEAVSGTNGSQPSAYSSLLIQSGGNSPYHDFGCSDDNLCRWGDYAAVLPDPNPPRTDGGIVWGTNQYSPANNASGWLTQIFAVAP